MLSLDLEELLLDLEVLLLLLDVCIVRDLLVLLFLLIGLVVGLSGCMLIGELELAGGDKAGPAVGGGEVGCGLDPVGEGVGGGREGNVSSVSPHLSLMVV